MSVAEKIPADAKPAGKSRGMMIPMIGAAVLSSVVAAGAVYFVTAKKAAPASEAAAEGGEHGAAAAEAGGHGEGKGGEDKGAKKGGANYFALTPAFVVNLNDSDANRFLQVDMEVRAKDSASIDALTLHMPQIRNSLLMLLGQQKFHDIESRDGKEALQKQVLESIQKILTAETGKPGIDAVYFTSFVMQ